MYREFNIKIVQKIKKKQNIEKTKILKIEKAKILKTQHLSISLI